MNNQRRKEIRALYPEVEALKPLIAAAEAAKAAYEEAESAFKEAARNLASDIEQIRDGEQEAFDNSPESVQSGERGGDMQAAIEHLDSAMSICSDLDASDCDADEIISELDAATADNS